MPKYVTRGTAAALCLMTAATTLAVSYIGMGRRLDQLLPEYRADAAIYGKIGEIRRTVDAHYVGKYDEQEAVDMAAAGFVAGIGDRWSNYLSAEEYQQYQLSFAGQSFGIGLYTSFSERENALRIVEVFPGSDGEALGLQKGDLIVGAEGKTVEEDGYRETIEAVAGAEGTMARVTIRRQAVGTDETVEMKRKTTDQTMVTAAMLPDGTTGFIRIYNFRRGAEKQLKQQVQAMVDAGAKQLVFDVRNNPGGSVDSVCEGLDLLLPKGRIMTLRTKQGAETIYDSDAKQLDLPMAVLVNAESISAAEFFAAALREYDKAVIVGEKTIGKGYSQQNYTLSDGSALHLSDNEYFTPKGKSLIGTGLTPDVTCAPAEGFDLYFSPPAEDVQLQAALRALQP